MKTSILSTATAEEQRFQRNVRRYYRMLSCNPSLSQHTRYVAASWYFDWLSQGKTPYEAYQEVIDTLEFMQRKEGEYHN